MKKLVSWLSLKALLLAVFIPATLFAATNPDAPQVEIINTSAGHSWIQLGVQFSPGLLDGEEYSAECIPQDSTDGSQSQVTITASDSITITNLQPGIKHRCEVSVKRSDGNKYFNSEPVFLSTVNRPKVKIEGYTAFDTYIDFTLTEIPLDEKENYIITCTPVNRALAVQSIAGKANKILVEGLKPDNFYSCQSAIQFSGNEGPITYNESEPVSIHTEKEDERIRILAFTPYDTYIDFVVKQKTLSTNEQYFVTCTPTLGNYNNPLVPDEIRKTSFSTHIRIDGLQPETQYSCQAGIQIDLDTENPEKLGGVEIIKTERFTANRVQVLNHSTGETYVTVTIKEFPLNSSEDYILSCTNLHRHEEKAQTSKTINITQNDLSKGVDYECSVGVQKTRADGTNYIDNRSASFSVSTKINAIPSATYADKVIEDWNIYVNPFPDTDLSKLYGQAAAELYRRSIISGYENGRFEGNNPVNRAEAAKFLLLTRKESVPPTQNDGRFSDVPNDVWYTKYVMTAAHEGVINGHPDGTFRPGATINRAEFLKMITKAFDIQEKLTYGYDDVPQDAWFATYAGAAQKYNLFPESNQLLQPDLKMTRYDVAIAIHQFLKYR